MIAGLRPLAKWRTLYFFDQFGCGEDLNDPDQADFKRTVQHALCFVEALKLNPGTVGLLGHSFGAHLAFGLLEKLGSIRELIFLNPVPSRALLRSRLKVDLSDIDAARIKQLTPLKTREAGVEIINIYSRIYCEKWPPEVPCDHKAFDMQLCGRVQASMGDFDFRPLFPRIPKQSLLVTGERDFIRPELLLDYGQVFGRTIEMKGAMHMPFLDRPKDFLAAVSGYFSR